jgi:two-component system chemotaxis response regulator CheY
MEKGKLKILIIDDVAYIRMQLKKLLKDKGYSQIYEASDGIEALEKFKEFHPDIVLLDLILPKIAGIDLLKIFLQIKKETKVMVISSSEEFNIEKTVLDKGALDFIHKPIEEDTFTEKLNKLISRESNISHEDVTNLVKKHDDYSEKFGIKLNAEKSVQILNIYGVLHDNDLIDIKKTISSLAIYNHKHVIINLNGVTKYEIDLNKFLDLKQLVEAKEGKLHIVILKPDITSQLTQIGFGDDLIKTESQALHKL